MEEELEGVMTRGGGGIGLYCVIWSCDCVSVSFGESASVRGVFLSGVDCPDVSICKLSLEDEDVSKSELLVEGESCMVTEDVCVVVGEDVCVRLGGGLRSGST